MKLGTPGFNGARLKEAREVRGISAASLAEMLGVSRQAISQYETGKTSPTEMILFALSDKLNVPISYFLLPISSEQESERIFFRSMASATKAARVKALAKYKWIKHTVTTLLDFVALPPLNLPPWEFPSDPSQIEDEDIDHAAEQLRLFWGLGKGPISDVVCLLENNGIIVCRIYLDSATLDGFSEYLYDKQHAFIVLAADKSCCVRSRFDAAHELAHLIFHRGVDKSLLNNRAMFNLIEQQAHRFAGAFLLPADTFARDILYPSLDGYKMLKHKWLFSISGMITRSQQLNIIDEHEARKLWMMLSARGWRKKEPYDDEIPVESPRILREAVLALDESHRCPKSDLLHYTRLASHDIVSICALPEDYFDSDRASVRIIDVGR